MTPRRPRTTLLAAIIERVDNHILIALPVDEAAATRRWQFPRGLPQEKESPESAMRRIAQENLGLSVDIVIGQPPLPCEVDGESIEIRYFFCGTLQSEATPGPYAEVLWIPKVHLLEYDFDGPSKLVVEWILGELG